MLAIFIFYLPRKEILHYKSEHKNAQAKRITISVMAAVIIIVASLSFTQKVSQESIYPKSCPICRKQLPCNA
jgi:hypothetical protein